MNTFNDDQYDRVCDENDDLQSQIAEVNSAIAARERLQSVLGGGAPNDWNAIVLACDEIEKMREQLKGANAEIAKLTKQRDQARKYASHLAVTLVGCGLDPS